MKMVHHGFLLCLGVGAIAQTPHLKAKLMIQNDLDFLRPEGTARKKTYKKKEQDAFQRNLLFGSIVVKFHVDFLLV